MMESFGASSRLLRYGKLKESPDILKAFIPILDNCLHRKGERYAHDENLEESATNSRVPRKAEEPPAEVAAALNAAFFELHTNIPGWIKSPKIVRYGRHRINGYNLAESHTSKRNSTVFFFPHQGAAPVPADIGAIFSVSVPDPTDGSSKEHLFLLLYPYSRADQELSDPFDPYPDFGAALWLSSQSAAPVLVQATAKIAPAIKRRWEDHLIVVKTMDKVSVRHVTSSD